MISPEYGKTPELLIGTPAQEVVKEILRINLNISELTLRLHPFVQEGPYFVGEDAIQKVEISREEILSHSEVERWINYLGVINEDEVDWGLLKEKHDISEDWPLARFLSISSRLKLPELAHIPMLDFDCRKTFDNLRKILDALHRQGQRGYVLVSRHFHFWGIVPLFEAGLFSEYNWREFLERSKENPLVDRGFINMSLERGFSCLRITEDTKEEKPPPTVIATL